MLHNYDETSPNGLAFCQNEVRLSSVAQRKSVQTPVNGPRADGPGGWDRMVLKWSKVVNLGTSL
jgi:hypothetical protein